MANKAVLCGINNYKLQTDLRGCINDVENISRLLEQLFGFDPTQIHKLFDDRVTKKNIKNEWEWLLEDAKAGDCLLFHFSGHGSYIPDDRNEESDRYDEITCLYDMDFYNPETFIRDDEWNLTIQQVPPGAHWSVIMDNCHSGTGTRMLPIELDRKIRMMSVDVRTHSERDRVRSSSLGSDEFLSSLVRAPNISTATSLVWNRENYEQILASREIVLPRFLVPPFEFQERLLTNARKKALRTQRVRSGSNLLLAACRDNQTAADAYIEGDFHGAFTYYLCKTLRQFPRIESRQLIETVARTLRENQFIQEPQHEGDNLPGPIFSRHEPVPSSNGVWERPPSLPEASGKLDRENQKLLIEAYLKLLDTIARRGEPIEGSFARAEENRHLVYVHGITQHRSGYSNSWWRALQQHIGQIFGDGHLQSTRWEVLWSDLVNPRALANDEIHREGLRLQIEAVLEERQRREIIDRTSNNQEVRQAIEQVRTLERGRGFAIDDFLSYMLDSKIRKQIIDRFIEVVEPLLSSGKQIDIISHSWGTVVAYEGLRELERNRSRPGRISNFFTVGSALSIGPARAHLKRENKDGIRPFYVDRWINIDAKGDLVGGMLADMFDVTEEYLDLIPTDCSQKLFGYSLVCAHSSYFDENNTTVNRDIFAKLMSRRSSAVGE